MTASPAVSAADFERALEVIRSAEPALRRQAARHVHDRLATLDEKPTALPRVRRMVVSSGTTAAREVRTRTAVEGASGIDVEVQWALEVIAAGLTAGAAAAATAADGSEAARLQLELVLSVLVAFAQ